MAFLLKSRLLVTARMFLLGIQALLLEMMQCPILLKVGIHFMVTTKQQLVGSLSLLTLNPLLLSRVQQHREVRQGRLRG